MFSPFRPASPARGFFLPNGSPERHSWKGRKNRGDVQGIVAGALALAVSFNPISPFEGEPGRKHHSSPGTGVSLIMQVPSSTRHPDIPTS